MKNNIQKIQNRVDKIASEIKWWYQPIKFCDGVRTHCRSGENDSHFYSRPDFGINKWNNFIKPFIPFDLKDKVILDLGSNAGLFLIQSIKEGAEFVYGVEMNVESGGFFEQSIEAIKIFSEIDSFNYFSKIKIIPKNILDLSWIDQIEHDIDISFALNTFYWITCDKDCKEIKNAKIKTQELIDKIFLLSEYLLILGDEGIESDREKNGLNSITSGLKTTIPFLKNRNIIIAKKDFNNTQRNPSIILSKRKNEMIKFTFSVDTIEKYITNVSKIEGVKVLEGGGFFVKYKDFCKNVLKNLKITDEEMLKTEYSDFYSKRLERAKMKIEDNLLPRLRDWKNLLLDIKENGLKENIVFLLDDSLVCPGKKIVNVDGCHRSVCLKVLGIKETEVKCNNQDYRKIIKIIKEYTENFHE